MGRQGAVSSTVIRAARGALGLAVALACFALAAPPAGAQQQPFEINAVLSLTGGNAFLGNEEREALEVAESVVNATGGIRGRPVKFAIADDQTNPQDSVQLVSALIAKNVPVILGLGISSACKAVTPLVVTKGPVTVCFTPAIEPPPGGYVFSSTCTTIDTISVGIRYLRVHGWTKIALVAANDATGADVENKVKTVLALAENASVQLVDNERFTATDISLAAQMAHIKASGAQAVYVGATGTPFGTVLHGMHDAGLDVPVYTNVSNMTYDQMNDYAQFLPREVAFSGMIGMMPGIVPAGPVRNAQSQFFTAMRAHDLRETSGHNLSWDATMMVVDAFRHLGTDATAAQLHAYLESLHDWAGINGDYDFRDGTQFGVGQRSIVVFHWDPAKHDFTAVSRPGGEIMK